MVTLPDGPVTIELGGVKAEVLIDGNTATGTVKRGTHTLAVRCRVEDLPPRWKVAANGVVWRAD